MKQILYILFFTLTRMNISAQYDREMELSSHYGINIMQLNSGSGHGSGISLNLLVQKGRKKIGLGVIMQNKDAKISGVNINYKIFTGRFDETTFKSKIIRPYFQYNMLYRKVTVDNPTILTLAHSTIELPENPGTISTIEHYISFGSQLKIYNRIYLDASLGAGIYIGSHDKINHPKSLGIHSENHGFTGLAQIGIGYRIN